MSAILAWLAKTDPTYVLGAAGFAVAWVWRHISSNKSDTWQKTVKAVLGNMMLELLDNYNDEDVKSYVAKARKHIEEHLWKVLKKRGVPVNSLTSRYVQMGLEEATQLLADEIRKLRVKQKFGGQ